MTDEPPISIEEARRQRRLGGKAKARDAVLGAEPAAASRKPRSRKPANTDTGGRVVMTEAGLIKRRDEQRPLLISGPFEVLTETRDDDAQAWGLLLRFHDRDGAVQQLVVTRDMFTGEKTELAALLARRGLYVHPGRGSAAILNEYLAKLESEKRARVVGRTGWHRIDGASVFVLPAETFGSTTAEIIYEDEASEPPPFNAAGTLAGWQAGVAERCVGNHRLMLVACCAFAAPLLEPMGEQGGGFHLHGKSSTGKTTLLRVAASVWGGEPGSGALAYIRQWRATGNGMEGLARAHSDTLLAMDEIGTADPGSLGETAYMLANGRGRERLDRSGRPRRVVKFRSLFLSTGEPSFADKLAEAQKHPRAGQEVRMADIAADAGAGFGVLNDLGDAPSVDAVLTGLREATTAHFGLAGPAFLRHLVGRLAREPGLVAELHAWSDSLIRDWLASKPTVDGQVRNVARRFALLAIAGELATSGGITGWASTDVREAIGACFQDWLTARGTDGAREDAQAVAQLRDFLSRHGATRFEDWREPEAGKQSETESTSPSERFRTVNRAGWKRWKSLAEDKDAAEIGKNEKGENVRHSWRYFLTPDAMAEALAGLDRRQAHKELIARGFLIPDGSNKASCVQAPPGHPRVRLYQVRGSILSIEDGAD